MTDTPRIALVGGLGYAMKHRQAIHVLQQAGRARLVAVANRRPLQPAEGAPLDGVALFDDHERMLAECPADITVVCTPPHTHAAIAADAVRAGCDILLEKPPVVTLDEFAELSDLLLEHGRRCQVGFQALGSATLPLLASEVNRGAVGAMLAVSGAGAWWRPDSYFQRSAWAGRRLVDGRPTADGALANHFSHGLMQALALCARVNGAAEPDTIEVERYRRGAVEVEDTACLRVTLRDGVLVQFAVTLSSPRFIYGDVHVVGDRGRALWEYPTDLVRLPDEPVSRTIPGRTGLLENLLDHRADPRVPLMAPLSSTRGIVAIIDALQTAPEPTPVPHRFLRPLPDSSGHVIDGIADIVSEAASRVAMFADLGVAWAAPTYRIPLAVTS
jgi:predicted dehydrogenase